MTGLSTEVHGPNKGQQNTQGLPHPGCLSNTRHSACAAASLSQLSPPQAERCTNENVLFKSTTFLCNTATLLYEVVGVGGLEKETSADSRTMTEKAPVSLVGLLRKKCQNFYL